VIVIDTSVWADHFMRPDERLIELNSASMALVHPFVIGELAAGNLRPWQRSVAALRSVAAAPILMDDEFYEFVWDGQLMGSGLSFVDLHLLASAVVSGHQLWTRDKRLNEAATKWNCVYTAV
jgi:predicted nucleic acid-binding protein